MTRLQFYWAATLGVAMALPAAAVRGEDPWWIVRPRPSAAPTAAAATIDRPSPRASLGRPVAVSPALASPAKEEGGPYSPSPLAGGGWDAPAAPSSLGWDAPAAPTVTPAGYDENSPAPPPRVVRGQPADPPPPGAPLNGPPPVAPPADGNYNAGVAVDQPIRRPFLEGCREWFNFGSPPSTTDGDLCKSDCLCGDTMISPVTNPFFFEDPRALTEIEPLFIIQKAPKAHGGGNDEFYGLQARLALSQRFSLVLNKLGFVSLNPSEPTAGYQKGTGFAEVDFGPKFTFWRDESLQNAAAVGLTLEAPVGSHREFQDTGTLGLDPYLTYGQSFGASSFGSFNFIGEVGYSFAVDDKRSEYLHASAHLDYDVLRRHHFYPLVEMNWFHTTRRGDNTDFTFDGADLVNFGSRNVTDRDLVTVAPGFRYKFNEWANIGTAVEFPLTRGKALQDARWTVDLIFRY